MSRKLEIWLLPLFRDPAKANVENRKSRSKSTRQGSKLGLSVYYLYNINQVDPTCYNNNATEISDPLNSLKAK